MWERRAIMMLCVLLAHALMLYALIRLIAVPPRAPGAESFDPLPITLFLEAPLDPPASEEAPAPSRAPVAAPVSPAVANTPVPAPGQSTAIAPPERVDWPIEGKKSAARVLAAEAEAERVAKMFAGPDGTWASLTKRQRSDLSKFRWRPGVDGLERDEKGNTIYRLPNGCAIVNFMFFGCPLGKQKVHGDMFDNMRLYFDEQRLPPTNEGNGTEPESLRPAN